MIHFLLVVIIQVKYDVVEVLWVLELKVDSWANALDSLALKLLDVMSKLVSTDPDFAQISFLFQNLLTWRIELAKHKHFFVLESLAAIILWVRI